MMDRSLKHSLYSIYSIRTILIDFIAITFIYLLPSLSHLTNVPLYIIEPMRLAVIFCLLHTNKKNTFLVAITIPLFSLVVSSHPAILKSVLIICELMINLLLFYFLVKKTNAFVSMFLSIVFSKIVYYSAKYIFIQMNMIESNLISTPMLVQWLIAIGLSLYAAFMFETVKEVELQ